MSLVMMVGPEVEGSYCSLYWSKKGKSPIVMAESYAGMVLSKYEANYYDDSDFYADVWDEASESVKSVCYATTRGWCDPNNAEVDASEEVKAKAQAYRVKRARHLKAEDLWASRKEYSEYAAAIGVSRKEVVRLADALSPKDFSNVVSLLKVKKFRSSFRESLAKQVRAWMAGESEYKSPLSAKQLDCLRF